MMEVTELGLSEDLKAVSRKTLVEGIIRPRLNELFTLVIGEIQKSGFGGMIPAGAVITGGGARTVRIADSARRTLALPLRVGLPYEIKGLAEEVQSPLYATAIGLVKYGSKLQVRKSGFTLSRLPHLMHMSPLKGTAGKFIDLIKSFLP